jgi:hypothetical protein
MFPLPGQGSRLPTLLAGLLATTESSAPATSGPNVPVILSAQHYRQARRLYIGSIPAGTEEPVLQGFFNSLMNQHGLNVSPGEPCSRAEVNSEKNFAFLEVCCVYLTNSFQSLERQKKPRMQWL